MNFKLILYIITGPIVITALSSLNINAIFKKNIVFQARLFLMLIFFSLVYLVTNFIYDFIIFSKIF